MNSQSTLNKQIFFFVTLFLLASCGGTKSLKTGKFIAEPEYSLSAVRFIDVDMERLRLEVDLEVINPNYLGIEFTDVSYELQVDGIKVMEGKLKEPLKVPAKGEISVTIPMEVSLDKMASGALSVMLNRQIDYALKAKLDSDVPILKKKTFVVEQAEILEF